LYFAIVAKLADPAHEITVCERDPAGVTYGWAVTFRESLLEALFRHDRSSAEQLRAAASVWTGRVIHLPGRRPFHRGGYGYSIARATLLEILSHRAVQLGVQVRHQAPVADLSGLGQVDLVVAADGANSRLRTAGAEAFGTRVETGRNRYLWLGTEQAFDGLVFALQTTPAGLIWLHGYPAAAGVGTCVVECSPSTWQGLGLDTADAASTRARLEAIFAGVLGGHRLLTQERGNPVEWRQFAHVHNTSWYHDNLVLVGDAAHTTHFSIGAGTREAIKDATALAWCLGNTPDTTTALADYDRRRRPDLERAQATARRKMAWCEDMDRHAGLDPSAFSAAMSGRPAPGPLERCRDRLDQLGPLRRIRTRAETAARQDRARQRVTPPIRTGQPRAS